ncbi:MAG: dockerin type I repeat-containing protein [Halobacteriota archaeon]
MKAVNNKSKRLLCMMLAVIMVFAVFTAGIGIVPVGANPGSTRSVVPDSVAPGGEVNVTIEFTTVRDFTYLFIRDYVPLGWDVTDMRVNEEANETLFLTEFNATNGIVLFFWVPIESGIDVTAEYTLHVPLDAEPGVYPLAGELVGWSADIGSWNATIQEGTVMVELSYGVNLSVDEEEKTTDTDVNATYYLTVENTGTEGDTYGLSVTSTEADCARLNKTSVSLGAGESEVVELNVSASSSDSYNTTVRAASAHASDEITVTTVVSAIEDTEAPVVSNPSAEPCILPEDTDNEPLWGELSNLSVVVTDESEIVSVTINLSEIGGSAAEAMTRIGDSNIWNVSVNASVGTAGWNGSAYVPQLLRVNATDEYGHSNTSVSIALTVMKNGDVKGDGIVNFVDVTYLANHLVGTAGYEGMEDNIADVNGDSIVNFVDVTYLANHLVGTSGYGKLK